MPESPPQSDRFRALLTRLIDGAILTQDDLTDGFKMILEGDIDDHQIAGFLVALQMRGLQAAELSIGAQVLRTLMTPVIIPEALRVRALDVCGTGGDGLHTFNVSTAVSFVLAACGVPVAKHGNRAMSSNAGAADVLEALGCTLTISPDVLARCLETVGICFMFAQAHHPAMRHVAPVRRALGVRTVFNLLGPLSNPAGVRRQLLGVYDPKWLVPMAEAQKRLGAHAALIICGDDGMDELTICGESKVAQLFDGTISQYTITPEDVGLRTYSLGDLRGGDAVTNAESLRACLSGAGGAYRDIVVLNSAAGLIVAESSGTAPMRSDDLRAGIVRACDAIDSGRAQERLDQFIAFTQSVQ